MVYTITGYRMYSDAVEQIVEGNHPLVKVLDSANFEPFVHTPNQVSAVMFIAPWCFICPVILPMWAEAATLLSNTKDSTPGSPSIGIAVVDVTKNPQIAEDNNIHVFPTMKIFVDEEILIYTHERQDIPFSPALVVNWINKHTNRTSQITSEQQLSDFLRSNHLTLVGMFDDSDKSESSHHEFHHSCLHFEDVVCIRMNPSLAPSLARLTNQPVATAFPAVVMVYDHDDRYAVFTGEHTQTGIDSFVKGRRLLTVNVFQPATIDYIIDAGLPMLFLITPANVNDESDKTALKAAAEKFFGSVVAITCGATQQWEQKLGQLLDVNGATHPVVRLLSHPPSDHHDHDPVAQSQSVIRHGLKYRPSADEPITVENLSVFIESFLSGQIKPYIQSEPEPQDPSEIYTPGSILVNAVGTNFDRLVTDDIKRDILMIFHAPWCGHCRKLMPTLRELGLKLGHAGRSLKVAKLDATLNEVPNVAVSGYPTIILYKAVNERVPIQDRDSVPYNGDRSIENFIEFLTENAVNEFSPDSPAIAYDDSVQGIEEL